MELNVGSLFAGIGGIDLGFKQAGFDISWAIENNKGCCKTYKSNFPSVDLIESDIREVEPQKLSQIDILTAGFPCQPFSIAGKQLGFKDKHGNLFYEIMRFTDVLKPEIIFFENVPNLIEHDNGKTFNIIHNELVKREYYIRYKVMRASEFGGVPQIRDRIYLLAFRDIDFCEKYHFPKPIKLETNIFSVLKQNERKHSIYYYTDESPDYKKYSRIVRKKDCIYRVYHESIKQTQNNMCPTLTASMGLRKNQVPLVRDDFGIRKLTIRECLDFQGFPQEFSFPHTISLNDACMCTSYKKDCTANIKNFK